MPRPRAPAPPRPRPDLIARVKHLVDHAHPSTEPFLRAYLLGWTASTLPALLRILLGAATTSRSRRRPAPRQLAAQLAAALAKGFDPRGLALAFGVAVGGAKWGEPLVEAVVRRAYFAGVERVRSLRDGPGKDEGEGKAPKSVVETQERAVRDEVEGKGKARETDESLAAAQDRRVAQDERNVRALSTFVSGSLSSLVALLILQSGKGYRRPVRPLAAPALSDDKVDVLLTPYAPPLPSAVSSGGPPPALSPAQLRATQSPTLDLTLFVLVRGVDTLARLVYERAPPARGRAAPLLRFIADHCETLVFWAASSKIMHAWFYSPELLPPSYSKWILQLARMDPRLLQLLRYARAGRFVYGKQPDGEVLEMCTAIAKHAGKDSSLVNPALIERLDCSFVHGRLGVGSCEQNALKRWARAFLDCLLIYLPVHAIPPLLFNFRRLLRTPTSSLLRILLAASRSSAFLATFVASVYFGVCMTRTRLPQLARGAIAQQPLDAGWCVLVGCAMCGASVLIENKRRRREMALYCAPRALYAILDELVPASLHQSPAGEALARWAERAVFALASGTVISASVHRPDAVSGIVRGVTGFAVKGWSKGEGALQ
ncbi:hypothetical protein JCM9279_004276 [Rhodotorula babjevae]